MRWIAVFLLMTCAPGAAGQVPTIEERLERLESEVRALRAENESLRRELRLEAASPPAAPVPPAAGVTAAAGVPPESKPLRIGGLIQAQGETGDAVDSRFSDDHSRFLLRRARLSATGGFAEDFDFKLELDLAGSLSRSNDLRAHLTDGFVTWRPSPYAWLRVGQFKAPFGHEQLYSDSRLLTPERTLVTDRLTLGRQVGLQLGGDLLQERLSYAVGAFNGSGMNQSFNDNDSFVLAGRLSGVVLEGTLGGSNARWTGGASGMTSRDDGVLFPGDFPFDSTPGSPVGDNIFAGNREGFGIDTQLSAGPFDFWAEYLVQRFEPDNQLPVARFRADGWYAQAAVFLIPSRLQVLTKYETLDPLRSFSGLDTDTWTTGINYYLRDHDLKLQLHYLSSDPPGGDRSNRFIARLQTAF